ncbi:methyltransferase, FkbM family [Variovorax sp. SRS16]|uniref:FkbM family methyltransferase n=1 Tax=Variovorax sp. SRS16 TaxID=282217 RepID=UPI0013173E94|nr:FkbM family methyltransferase [Variovorax sp. SRS16]VTU34033.1 methyltransferase, FkbM family [Variovorax sp. SRS16]
MRLSYPLGSADMVFDLGGFVGDFSAAIHEKYSCTVYLFEPVLSFFAKCQARFASDEKIHCFNYGLSSSPQTLCISLDGDASSIARDTTGQLETIRLEQFDEFLDQFNIQEVALLKLNIEGGEFDVLEHLIETGKIVRVRHLQVQFHDFARDAIARRNRIRAALARTHRQDWCYHFVWESWTRL